MLELDRAFAFDAARDAELFAALPERPGVLLIELHPPDGVTFAEPFLMRTASLRRATERLLSPPDRHLRRLNLRGVASRVNFRVAGSRLELSLAHYLNAKRLFPFRYRDLVRLRRPVLLKVNLRHDYPRCYVTRRVLSDDGFYLGPFPSRKSAGEFASRFLDFFKVRRCQIRIRRDPAFPGCIYSEMKMCLAPCFAGCTAEEYSQEAAHLIESLASRGESLLNSIATERDAASAALEFERAAAQQKRHEKLREVLRGLPKLARRLDQIEGVILQRGAEEDSVTVFPVREGFFLAPFSLDFDPRLSRPHSAEEVLRAGLETRGSDETTANAQMVQAQEQERGEHLALLARWYFSSPREGEIFFREKTWPYRRILHACSRVLTGAAPPLPSSPQSPPA